MRRIIFRRSIAFLLSMVFLLSGFPVLAAPAESEAESVQPETRATQTIAQRAQTLKTKIQSMPTAGGERNARVDLTDFAPTAAEGDPIFGLRGKYYVAYLPEDDTKAMVLDGSWGVLGRDPAPLPSVPVAIEGNHLDISGVSGDVSFTLLPAEIFKNMGRFVFLFSNGKQTDSTGTYPTTQLGSGVNQVQVSKATSVGSAPRILSRRTEDQNTMQMFYSFSNGAVYALRAVNTDATPSFGWVNQSTGDNFALYRIWSTVDLREAIGSAANLLNDPGSYVTAEYENFLSCLEDSIETFETYNALPSDMIAPYVYPQEEMDRLALELDSYHTLLTKKNYIDIPVEIIDFRSDGYLFENTSNYSFRVDKRDAILFEQIAETLANESSKEKALEIADGIIKKFSDFPDLPGEVAQPVQVSGEAANMRTGLTEKSLVNGKLVYNPQTITFMAHLICKKESNATGSVAYFVPGSAKTLHEYIYESFYVPYTAEGATEEEQNAILGSWDQTLTKIGGTNGNPMTWSQVKTAHDAAYYLLTYLWQPVPETDTFYDSADPDTVDPSLTNQADNRYNKVVTERDTLRLYGDAKGVYTLNSWQQMGYSGRYAFNTGTANSGIKPKFAPIDGMGFEEPGVMKNLYDTDPGSNRVVIEGYDGYDANYNLSMHASGSFVYYEDQNLYFEFNGDDDVYFFIDGYLALDIGSSHAQRAGICKLNEFEFQDGSKLVNGKTYTFDMFYTERATPDSNLMFATNIKIVDDKALTTKGQYLEKHGTESRVDSKTGFGVELEENAMVAIGDTVAYSFELLNTRTVPLTNVSFTDDTLGVSISKDSLTLCDPGYTLTNGAKTEITDIVVAYRTYSAAAGVNGDTLTMVSYDTMVSRIREATTEPTGTVTQFVQLDSGSYGVKISSEEELKTLLELGIPVNCQMIVYGFKRIMITTDQPYINLLQSLAHYKRVSVEGTGLVYGDPIPVSGTAERTLRVPDPSSITPPTAEAERYVIDYNKPVELSLTDLTKHVYSNRLVPVGNLVGFVSEGANGTILRRAPEILYCEKATGGKTMETAHGTVTRAGDKLTYTLNGFLSEIDRFYGVVEISGLFAQSDDGREYPYPYILVEIQIIPASIMYYETNLAAGEFSNESGGGLYFDFKNDPADQKRYDSSIYSHANFDDTSLIRWVGNMPDIRVDNGNEGTLTVNAKYISDPNATKGMYVDPSASGSARDFPLRYTLTGKDVFEIRFKMENFTSPNSKPYVALHPTFDGRNSVVDDTKVSMYFDTDYLTNGTYYTATISLSETSYKYTYLSSLRAYFGSVNSQSEAVPGTLTIDYIYVGPADKTPVGEHLYFDFTNREADQNRYNTALYGNGNYYNYDVGTWRHRSGTLEAPSYDTENGKMILTTKEEAVLSHLDYKNEVYIQASPGINSNLNMNYHPKEGDVLKIRFRMSNIKQAEGKYFALRFAFHTDRKEVSGVSPLYSFSNHNYSYTYPGGSTEGEYKELTIDLWQNSTYHKDLLTSFRLTFCGISIEDESKGTGKIEIDYIYIGSEENFAQMERLYSQTWQTVTDGTSHPGELQETDFVNRTVYDMEKCGDDQRFFIGFDDTDEDRARYASAVYNNKNRDLSTNWSKSGGVFDHRTDNDAGLYKLMAKASLAANEFPAVYQDLTNLSFNPAKAEVYQVRFKMENFIVPQVNNQPDPYIDLHYKTGSSAWLKIAGENWVKYFDAEYASNGQFVTLTLDLTEEFRSAPSIHSMRFFFGNIQSPGDNTNGILSIDYIYIGPRDRAPADTVYGYDRSYDDDTKLSNGSSVYVEGAGVRVNGTETEYTETLFSFTGTGFDIISRTGSQQGTIRVSVFSDPARTKDSLEKALTVNNKGELELNQIPVVSIQGLPHGTHYVTIGVNKKVTGSPLEMLNRGNQFYFDAIRIYDPMDITGNAELQKVYKLDKELDPRIKEVRNILLTSAEFKELMGSTEGAVFIDSYQKETVVVPDPETGKPETVEDPDISINDHYALSVQTYNKVGPKNEVYLSPGQAVAFRLKMHSSAVPESLDIGAKTINGTATKLVAGIVTAPADMESVLTVETATRKDLTTATAMYYPLAITDNMISNDRYCYIVIMNGDDSTDPRNGDHVLSITDIKVCYSNVLTQQLPEDGSNDPEIHKRTVTEEEPISFLVDGNTAEAAAFFLRKEMETPVLDSDTKIYHSLNLASDISLNYVVAKSDLEGADSFYMQCEVPLYENNLRAGSKTLILQPVEKGGLYYFTLDGLTAVQMNDVIRATLYMAKDGQTFCSETDMYSIAQYAYAQLAKDGIAHNLKTLCADLLRYGAKAQIFKNYRTDNLADANMTEAHKAYLSDLDTVTFGNTNRVLNDLENAPITWAGKVLNLESKVTLKFVFDPADYSVDLSDLTLRISYEDVSGGTKLLTIENPELYNEAMGYYVFTLDTLLAAELRTAVSVQIYAGDTPASCTMEYSADTYGNNKTGTLGELCKALFAYSDSAKDYFVNT